jgi:hypothetical protein
MAAFTEVLFALPASMVLQGGGDGDRTQPGDTRQKRPINSTISEPMRQLFPPSADRIVEVFPALKPGRRVILERSVKSNGLGASRLSLP